jgi:hypothetical protein
MSSSLEIPSSPILKRSSALLGKSKRQRKEEVVDQKYLPLEVLEIVAAHLNKKDLASFYQVSDQFKAAAQAAKIHEQKYLARQELRELCDLQPARPEKIVSYLDLYKHIVINLNENLDDILNLTSSLKQELIPQLKCALEAFYTDEVASSIFQLSKSCYQQIHEKSASCLNIEQEYQQLKYALVVKALTHVASASSNPEEARGFALKRASDEGYETIALELLATGSITRLFRVNALYSAAGHGHLKLVEVLLKSGQIHQQELSWAAISAAGSGHLEILKAILATGPFDIAPRGLAVTYAARNGHLTCVQALLENGEIDSINLNNGLSQAIINNNEAILNVLLEKNTLNEKDISTCVQKAATFNRPEMVKALLAKGPISQYSRGMAVWSAVQKGNLALVETLLANGPIDKDRCSFALNSAKEKGHLEIAQLLESKIK